MTELSQDLRQLLCQLTLSIIRVLILIFGQQLFQLSVVVVADDKWPGTRLL
ncbi:hypothetical protein T4E_3233 [Trichinella pseudospiralis]|uniref:Uncharacterized protein n=1 Tax=Trichinella pseudospiralis TaxID=6337 RepID=A0A0V0XCN5_TRIPS|nr:hypothetical protein T4E_3233 [Trichinella pseudospiralis]